MLKVCKQSVNKMRELFFQLMVKIKQIHISCNVIVRL